MSDFDKNIPLPRCVTTRYVVQVIRSLLSWTRLITLVSMTRHSDLPPQKNRHPNRIETPYENQGTALGTPL